MTIVIEDATAENYRKLRKERGCSWGELAGDMDHGDARLAAWMREQSMAEDVQGPKPPPERKDAAPRGRRGRPQQTA